MKIFFSIFTFLMVCVQLSADETKYALVTGASRGIGKAIVEELLRKDETLRVFAVARGKKDLEKLEAKYQNRVIPIVADISQTRGLKKIQKIVRSSLGESGSLLYLIHNAAIIAPLGDLDYLQEQPINPLLSAMDKSYRINVIAPYLITLALLPEIKKANEPRILFVSSRAGEVALPGVVTYSCTKAALDHLALNLQASLNGKVAIGLLHPGEVDTDMQEDLRTPNEEQVALSSYFRGMEANHQLISSTLAAQFIIHLLYETSFMEFSEKKWDIYSTRPTNLPEKLSKAIGSPPPDLNP